VVEVVETVPEHRYLLAIDESKKTLYEITKVCGTQTNNINKDNIRISF
jgi:fructose-bisphosphate aldolase class 1